MSPLLNYTTSVPVSRTLGEMTKGLVAAGARSIQTVYDAQGRAVGMGFVVMTAYGPRRFDLPVNVEAVQKMLVVDKVEPRYRMPEHAERVAWRIVKDWLEAQLALIRTTMVSLEQVMLPYMEAAPGVSVYDQYRQLGEQQALEGGEP